MEKGINIFTNEAWSQPPKKFGTKTNFQDENTERDLALTVHAAEFVDNVGMQGVRYVCKSDAAWVRRFIWLSLVLAGAAYCIYVTIENVNNFLTYPTTIKIESHIARKVEFPAVTLCNYNVFQRSRMTTEEAELLQEMYKPYEFFYNETNKDPNRYSHINMEHFFTDKAFNYTLDFCSYQGITCNASHFYTKIRDVGVCVTFDPNQDENMKYQLLRGNKGGLLIGFMIFEREWTHGPFMNLQGLIVLVHDHNEDIVMVENFGMGIPIGKTVNLIVSKRKRILLEPPHGQCGTRELRYFSKYTKAACEAECELNKYVNTCGCKLAYMPGNDLTCDNIQLLNCNPQLIANAVNSSSPTCDCPPECQKNEYDVRMTQSELTEGSRQFIIENYFGFDLAKSGVEIRVYYPSLSYKTLTQEATYSVEKLLCDIGGAAGLFLGASFMSICEFFDFIFFITWISSIQCWKKKTSPVKALRNSK